jgi:hypothetical protein
VPLHHPYDAVDFARKILVDHAREHFLAIYLESRHRPIAYPIVSIGTANQSLVDPREVFQPAIAAGATALVLLHDHLSDNVSPSADDREVTQRLVNAGELLGIRVLDHIIFTTEHLLGSSEELRRELCEREVRALFESLARFCQRTSGTGHWPFFDLVTRSAYTTRLRWRNGDIAFWDNRATAHLAPQDLDDVDVERVLYRTTIKGDIPVGPDGFRSQIVEGKEFGVEVPEAWKKKSVPVPAMPVRLLVPPSRRARRNERRRPCAVESRTLRASAPHTVQLVRTRQAPLRCSPSAWPSSPGPLSGEVPGRRAPRRERGTRGTGTTDSRKRSR